MDKSTHKRIIEFVRAVASQNAGYVTSYLFGSYANKTNHADSDIDIALVFDPLKDSEKFDLQVLLMLQAANFDNRIEPHPISKEDIRGNSPFALQILKTGVEISIGKKNGAIPVS